MLSILPHKLPTGIAWVLAALLGLSLLIAPIGDAFGHGGGTNSAGCHTNRKTGDYHCHRSSSLAPGQPTWCHVVGGEQRCGYALSTCGDLVDTFGGYCARK